MIGITNYQSGDQNGLRFLHDNAPYVPPPPTNDRFVDAISEPDDAVIGGSNAGATIEAGEGSLAGQPAAASVWYSRTPTRSGEAPIDTFGSSFDSMLGF